MKIITLEEHFATPKYIQSLPKVPMRQAFHEVGKERLGYVVNERLLDMDDERLKSMDKAGIERQVLSFTTPGPNAYDAKTGVIVAKEANETLAGTVQRHPDRFSGFAAIPVADPDAAALELDRCVNEFGFVGGMLNGHYQGSFLDDPKYLPIFERAHSLSIPLYLHPTVPHSGFLESYLAGYEELHMPAWGFAVDTSCHFLRLALSGIFDKFPNLQIVLGHLGENIPFGLERLEVHTAHFCRRRGLKKTLKQYFQDNVWITTSGNFSTPALLCSILALGIDRVLFSVDWPYESNEDGVAWLKGLPLSKADLEKLAHGNAEKLLNIGKGRVAP